MVVRTREDFKWLYERLKEEYPNVSVPRIDDGKLESSQIEAYFRVMSKSIKLTESRSLVFFLTAERRFFEVRRNRDNNTFKEVFNSLFGTGKIDIGTLGIDDSKRCEEMEKGDEKKLDAFVDDMSEYISQTRDSHRKLDGLFVEIAEIYDTLKSKLVKVADTYRMLCEGFQYANKIQSEISKRVNNEDQNRLHTVYKHMDVLFQSLASGCKSTSQHYQSLLSPINDTCLTDLQSLNDLCKKRHDLLREQAAEVKKYAVETNLSSVKDLFKSRKNPLNLSDKAAQERIDKRDIILFNLAVRIRNDYVSKCVDSTKYVFRELAKFFYMMNQTSEKVIL